MSTKVEATIEDLYKVEGKAELVNGEIVLMAGTGGLPHYAALEITMSLMAYQKTIKKGYAIADNAVFVVNLPHRKSFSPDAGFYIGEITMKFFQGAPVFAVEVRSENDYGPRAEREMAKKRADYFAAGTLVVWDVDLLSDNVVRVFRSSEPENPTIYGRGEIAEAEPAVLRWTMAVNDLFPDR
ncbi:MAG TPA: Uma2 family endonuclease [Pyrinomonadaceae bacterium]|nr:Uma2 family endonuclease [Pyrinomonadaceae bacterium]HLM24257.1 Uma2 family endonuclease [Pyrinomonadaceae bacterium]